MMNRMTPMCQAMTDNEKDTAIQLASDLKVYMDSPDCKANPDGKWTKFAAELIEHVVIAEDFDSGCDRLIEITKDNKMLLGSIDRYRMSRWT